MDTSPGLLPLLVGDGMRSFCSYAPYFPSSSTIDDVVAEVPEHLPSRSMIRTHAPSDVVVERMLSNLWLQVRKHSRAWNNEVQGDGFEECTPR